MSAEVNQAMLAKFRSRGFLYLIGIAINRVVPAFLFRAVIFRIYQFGRTDPSESLASYDDGIRFEWCENEEQFKMAEEITFFRSASSDQQAPLRACLAYDGDEAVGGVWIASGSFYESDLGLTIRLQSNQRWLFAANVSKSHRRRGIYGRMLRYVLSSAEEASDESGSVRSEILASINPTNKASMAAHRSLIEKTWGCCIIARLLSLHFCISNGNLKTTRILGLQETALVLDPSK